MTDAREAWGAAAGSWANAPAGSELITHRMAQLAAPKAGDRILELACGTGVAGIAAARAVDGEAELVLSDFAPEMVAAAVAEAKAAGLSNVTGRELDLEALAEPDGTYDIALCRMGIMLVADPGTAAREIARVLRPGGTAVVAVWGPRERNPWLRVIFDVLGELWGIQLPPAEGPHPFALDNPERLASLLEQGGLAQVRVEEVVAPLQTDSAEDWWETVAEGSGPLGQLVASVPEDQQAEVRQRALGRISTHLSQGEIPRSALIAGGRRAAMAIAR